MTGKRDSQAVEGSLHRDLGPDALKDLWASVRPVPEAEDLELATSELHSLRREGRAAPIFSPAEFSKRSRA